MRGARPSPRAAPRRPALAPALLDLALLLLTLGVVLIGPRVVDALAAREWAWYHARGSVRGFRAADEARLAGREAARALDRAAPLPFAADGVRAVLALGHELEITDPAAAASAYAPVLEALGRLESSGWRAVGLGDLAAEVRSLEQQARARMDASAPRP